MMSKKYFTNYYRCVLMIGIPVSTTAFALGIALFLFPRVVLAALALAIAALGAVMLFSILRAVCLR